MGTGRFYEYDGVQYPSVTTILGAIAKPALINWASNGARDATIQAARSVHEVFASVGVADPASFEAAVRRALGNRPAHLALSERATGIGTMVHHRIEAEMKVELGLDARVPELPREEVVEGRRVMHPAWSAYESYLAWRKKHAVRPIAIEQRVYSKRFGFAGTCDLVAYVDDLMTLADYKTSKAVYDEYRLQIAAYRAAALEMEQTSSPLGGLIVRFPKDPGDSFEAHDVPWSEQTALFDVFLAVRAVWAFAFAK